MKLLLLLSLVALANCMYEYNFFRRQRCYAPTHLPGPQCYAMIPRYTFSTELGRCVQFIYGGCNPSPNNFETLQECRQTCEMMPRSYGQYDYYGSK
ncbi:unnamed protein product [Heligmosomoides polygyrus]|uniref:BPTI/Kunitz inhibitor domain-containing protein n=1 Tax=Heligmosomoides polygyrus TaxID=6339 RepID=A0A183FXX1_HELPZ|nr:unnamed protein product [Heligmosomoides polygyrus]